MLREHCGREEKIKELEDQKLCCEVVISRNVGSLFIKSSQYACSNISYKRVTPIEMSKWGLNTKEELLETLPFLYCKYNITHEFNSRETEQYLWGRIWLLLYRNWMARCAEWNGILSQDHTQWSIGCWAHQILIKYLWKPGYSLHFIMPTNAEMQKLS